MLDELASFPLRFSDLLLSPNSQMILVEAFLRTKTWISLQRFITARCYSRVDVFCSSLLAKYT